MINAAGILFLTPERTALFLQRGPHSDAPGTWCLPGGSAEDDETPLQTAEREALEEVGVLPRGERALLTRQVSQVPAPIAGTNGASAVNPPPAVAAPVDFSTFLQKVPTEFEPKSAAVREEHVGHAWAPVENPPQPLHPGCQVALDRLSMDELGVARAMAAGQLTSPQRYENVWLFDIRITGTGTAYRKALDEFAYRPPEHYCTDEFLARCAGLPVIWEHPDKATLTSREYSKRNIGSVFVPYVSDGVRHPPNEVWAIAKVFDDAGAEVMRNEDLSTSPSVAFRELTDNTTMTLEGGSKLLIEGKPSLLDHIAICERGVWDKAGPPTGVVRGDSDMTEAEMKAKKDAEEMEAKKKADAEAEVEAKKKADAEAGEAVDKLLKCVDSLGKRMDAWEEDEKKKADARADAAKKKDGETEGEDFKREDGESDEMFEKRKDKHRRDMARKDVEEEMAADKAKKDAEEEDKKKADVDLDSRVDALVAKRIADVEKRIPKALDDAEYEKMAGAQARADSVFAAFGKSAPRPLDGESLLGYRRRLAGELKTHSAQWKDVSLAAIADDAAFSIVETSIYNDAAAVARNPIDLGEGELRMVPKKDDSGRTVTEWVGHPASWMSQFSGARRQVSGIRTKNS